MRGLSLPVLSRCKPGICFSVFLVLAALVSGYCCRAEVATGNQVCYARWSHGPPSDPNFFPIAVWLQSPANAERFRQAGPTEACRHEGAFTDHFDPWQVHLYRVAD